MNFRFRNFLSKNWDVLIFVAILGVSIVLSLLRVNHYDIAFTYDQAREMTEIRRMVVTRTPLLIGPATDIIGLFYGPFWAYFNTIPFLLFGGDPLGLVHFQIFTLHFISLFIYFVLRKKDKALSFYATTLFLFSPVAAFAIKFSWNANSAYYFAALIPILYSFRSKIASFFEGFLCGVILQVEAAVGILFFPISFFIHLKRPKKEKHLIPLILGYLVTFLPQIAFEFRHGFIMTRSLIGEFSGGTEWLGQKLTLVNMIFNRFVYFRSMFSGASFLPLFVVLAVIVLALIIGKRDSDNLKFLKTNLYIILAFLIFFIIFPFNIRDWYLYGLVPFSIYSFATSLTIISQKYLFKVISIIIIIFTVGLSVSSKINYLYSEKGKSNDLANLSNMLFVIDNIYTNAAGGAFKVYTYTPQVYDLTYQYLFWWYGTKKYGYQPSDISYFPGVPEYIKDNSIFWTKKKESTDETTYLIIEKDTTCPDRALDWRNSFPKALKIITLPFDIKIEIIDDKKI